jgi:hypothetical protein
MAGNFVLLRSTKTDKDGKLVTCSLSSNYVKTGKLVWNEKNNFTCQVPVRLVFKNLMTGQEEVLSENWAQELLDSYGTESHKRFAPGSPQALRAEANSFGLELVMPEAPKPKAEEPEVVKRPPGRPRTTEKEKEDEKTAV